MHQKLGEVVLVPTGCAFQIRNTQCCIRVNLNFLTPESAGAALGLAAEARKLRKGNPYREDKVSRKTLCVLLFVCLCCCFCSCVFDVLFSFLFFHPPTHRSTCATSSCMLPKTQSTLWELEANMVCCCPRKKVVVKRKGNDARLSVTVSAARTLVTGNACITKLTYIQMLFCYLVSSHTAG